MAMSNSYKAARKKMKAAKNKATRTYRRVTGLGGSHAKQGRRGKSKHAGGQGTATAPAPLRPIGSSPEGSL